MFRLRQKAPVEIGNEFKLNFILHPPLNIHELKDMMKLYRKLAFGICCLKINLSYFNHEQVGPFECEQ